MSFNPLRRLTGDLLAERRAEAPFPPGDTRPSIRRTRAFALHPLPVLLDGFASTAAAAVLFADDPRALDHCVVAHRSVEPGHLRLIQQIGQRPLFGQVDEGGRGEDAVRKAARRAGDRKGESRGRDNYADTSTPRACMLFRRSLAVRSIDDCS